MIERWVSVMTAEWGRRAVSRPASEEAGPGGPSCSLSYSATQHVPYTSPGSWWPEPLSTTPWQRQPALFPFPLPLPGLSRLLAATTVSEASPWLLWPLGLRGIYHSSAPALDRGLGWYSRVRLPLPPREGAVRRPFTHRAGVGAQVGAVRVRAARGSQGPTSRPFCDVW